MLFFVSPAIVSTLAEFLDTGRVVVHRMSAQESAPYLSIQMHMLKPILGKMEMRTFKTYSLTARLALTAFLTVVTVTGTSTSLEFPRFGNFLGLSEKASDEIREEERISEVLNQDSSYTSLFKSITNPDVPLKNYVKPGEELKYQAKWRGLPAGNIRCAAKRMAMLKNRQVFVFEVNLESNDFLNAFYPVRTSINSYVDADNGRSYLIRRRVSERNRDYKDRLEFKYDFRRAGGIPDPVSKYSKVGESGKEETALPFPIPGNMQDMVSIIYYIRGADLKNVGDSCNLMVGGRKKPVITKISVVDEEELSIPNIGTFDCLIVEPSTDGTNLSGNLIATRGGERVWLEKNSLVPVMVTAQLPKPMGFVAATLVEASNCELMQYAKE